MAPDAVTELRPHHVVAWERGEARVGQDAGDIRISGS
jgi:hypothetical protein